MHPFRAAVEAQDIDAALALLHPDVVFRSPVVYRQYDGHEAVAVVLRAAFETFEDFRYVREFEGPDGHVLVFEARVGERELEGADFLTTDAEGRITELTVMVRPMSGMHALAEAMGRLLAGA